MKRERIRTALKMAPNRGGMGPTPILGASVFEDPI